jgi:hypothetical protein
MQAVLDVAQRETAKDLGELFDKVLSSNLINFLYRRTNKITEEVIAEQSQPSIRKAMRFCIRLGLIDTAGKITQKGVKALSSTRFDSIVASQIVEFLSKEGLTIQKIDQHILNMFQRSPVVLPTAKSIWEACACSFSPDLFSQLLTLLSHCDRIYASRRKIYLRVQKRGEESKTNV